MKPEPGAAPPAIEVDRGACVICGACCAVCPAEALVLEGLTLTVRPERCRPCGQAALVCPTGALRCPRPLKEGTACASKR